MPGLLMAAFAMLSEQPLFSSALFFFLLKSRAAELSLAAWLSKQTGGSSATLW